MKLPDFDFHHYAVSVPNMEEAIDWYSRVFDASLERRFYIDTARTDVALLRRGPLRFEIFAPEPEVGIPLPKERREPESDFQAHGNKHAAFRVDDIDALVTALEAKGADIAVVIRTDIFRGCFVRDCAGNLIEFLEHRAA